MDRGETYDQLMSMPMNALMACIGDGEKYMNAAIARNPDQETVIRREALGGPRAVTHQ